MRDFAVFHHPPKTTPIRLEPMPVLECRPVELHVIEDGTIDDKPCLVFVLQGPNGSRFTSCISKEMLREGIDACPQAKRVLEWKL